VLLVSVDVRREGRKERNVDVGEYRRMRYLSKAREGERERLNLCNNMGKKKERK